MLFIVVFIKLSSTSYRKHSSVVQSHPRPLLALRIGDTRIVVDRLTIAPLGLSFKPEGCEVALGSVHPSRLFLPVNQRSGLSW